MSINDFPTDMQKRRLESISWLSSVGRPIELDLPLKMDQIETKADAVRRFQAVEWENTGIQAQNRLTAFLSDKHSRGFSNWNRYARAAREYILGELDDEFRAAAEAHEIDPRRFVVTAQWNVLHWLMEEVYADCKPPLFFSYLLDVYEAGHFPCGWDGDWPEGKLLVF